MQKEMSGLRLELEEREDKIDEYEERIAELTQQLGEDGLKRSMDSLKKPSFDRKVCCIRLLPPPHHQQHFMISLQMTLRDRHIIEERYVTWSHYCNRSAVES